MKFTKIHQTGTIVEPSGWEKEDYTYISDIDSDSDSESEQETETEVESGTETETETETDVSDTESEKSKKVRKPTRKPIKHYEILQEENDFKFFSQKKNS